MKKSDIVVLAGIILLGAVLRFIWITRVPPALSWDEASVGYDAYSIIESGKDQWGQSFPLTFKSFGEYKFPINIYFTALSAKIFGYGIFTVRMGSAIFGVINITLLFFLSLRLTKNKTIAHLSALFLSVSPWAIQFSRANWETNYALFFYFIGVVLFVKGIEKNKVLIILSFVFFGLDLFTYNAAKIFVPLFILALVVIYFRELIKNKIYTLLGLFIFFGFILINLILPDLSGLSRFNQVTFQKNGGLQLVVKSYLSHFTPRFLFISGDHNPRHSVQSVGEFYIYDIILLPIGIYYLLKHKSKLNWVLLAWFFLSPVPASIATEAPHASRSMYALGGWQIVSAMGFYHLLSTVKRPKTKLLFTALSLVIFMLFTESYLLKYFKYYPTQYSDEWQYGYMKIFTDRTYDFDKYNKVIVSDQYGQPYIFALYYLKHNPNSFRKSVIYNPVGNHGEQSVRSFGNFIFKTIESSDLQNNTLVFATPNDNINNEKPIGEIRNLNGQIVFWVYSK